MSRSRRRAESFAQRHRFSVGPASIVFLAGALLAEIVLFIAITLAYR